MKTLEELRNKLDKINNQIKELGNKFYESRDRKERNELKSESCKLHIVQAHLQDNYTKKFAETHTAKLIEILKKYEGKRIVTKTKDEINAELTKDINCYAVLTSNYIVLNDRTNHAFGMLFYREDGAEIMDGPTLLSVDTLTFRPARPYI